MTIRLLDPTGTIAKTATKAESILETLQGRKVGFVYPGAKEQMPERLDIIRAGVRASGYALQPADIVSTVIDGKTDQLAPAIADVLAQKVAVYIAGGPVALRTAHKLSSSVPIIARLSVSGLMVTNRWPVLS